ncbi:MAG TPA: GNVR domain-containing protein [Candidatus Udaeobacter sp.]|jgi:capsular exopolysaccharide synthesis family protein|nr:GNVR domain-containing protein [Candidatus Udaeobacter sp.]
MEQTPGRSAPLDIGETVRVLRRRKWLMLLPWLASIAVGLAAAFLLPPIYVSGVTLQFQRPQQLAGSLSNISGGAQSADQQAGLMRGQVQSSLFLRNIVIASGLKSDPATRAEAQKQASHYAGLTPEDEIEAYLIDFLRNAVTIKPVRGDFIQIQVEDHTGERARRFAEALANQFVVSSKAAQLEAVRATQEFSIEQQQIYKHKLDESEARLEAARRSSISQSVSGSSLSATNLPRARGLLEQADVEIDDLRQRVETLRGQLQGKARDAGQALSNSDVSTLSGQIISLERQLASAMLNDGAADAGTSVRVMLAKKTEDLENVLTSNAARDLPNVAPDVRETLVRSRIAQVNLQAAQARRAYLSGQVSGYTREAESTPTQDIEIQRLTQDVENNRALYNSFLNQSAAAQIAEAFENAKVSGRFVVVEPASRPMAPSKPNRLMLVLLSVVMGAIVGVGTVLVVEQHDQSMKNAEEVESLLGLPVLGAVPRVEELERSRRRSRSSGSGATPQGGVPIPRENGLLHRLKVESPLGLEFRRVYLKLARTRGRALPRTLLVTSSTRGEGKTTTTASLGITMARELKEKVLLVDFDLRSPTLHRTLGLPTSSWGLAQMLHQRSFDERFVRATVLPTLDFLAAGRSERPAAELVDLASVEWFMQEALNRYAMIVIDAPPNLAVPDPLILGRAVEGVLYVIKAGSTVRKAAEYGVKVQREARDNVLGVLLNDVGEILPHYYGYRYSSYGYTSEVAGGES